MRAILEYCIGGTKRAVPTGTFVLHEGGKTGHLYVLIEGRLEVIKGEASSPCSPSRARCSAKCRCCSTAAHRHRARGADSTIYEFDDAAAFLRDQPAVALLIAQMLAQRLNVATTYLADLMHQYAGHGTHLAMVGEILQSMINLPPMQVSPGSDRQSDPRI